MEKYYYHRKLNLSLRLRKWKCDRPQKNEITLQIVTLYNDLGFFLSEGGKAKEAIELLNVVVEAIPNRTVAYLNLGDSYWKQFDSSRAIKNYSKYSALMNSAGKEFKIPKRVKE